MPYLKPKHFFYFLMILAGASFFAPPRYLRGRISSPTALLAPVSWPSSTIAHFGHDMLVGSDLSSDDRKADVVKRENEAIKNENSALHTRVTLLEQRDTIREQVGDIRQWCTPFPVSSTDSGPRKSLGILGNSWKGLHNGMIAIYARGIVGQVEGAGITGARVRLITDTGFRLRVSFARFDGAHYLRLTEPDKTLAEGTGRGGMIIDGLSQIEVKADGLKVNDFVVLNEPEWPSFLQGRLLGHITSIGLRPQAPQMSKIVVEPEENLLRLNEVLIITRLPESQVAPPGE